MARISRKELKHDEFVDGAADFGQWVEDNWKTLAKGFAAVAVLVVLALVWMANRRSEEQAGKILLARAIQEYEKVEVEGFASQEKVEKVLDPLDKAIRRAGDSPAGIAARLYRGMVLLHLNRLPESVKELETVVAKGQGTLRVTAYPVLAEAYVKHGRPDDAVLLLEKLLDPPSPDVPEDQILLLLGRIQLSLGRTEEAHKQWQRVVDEHPTSGAAGEARQLLES